MTNTTTKLTGQAIDLTLLKKLVAELESSLTGADTISADQHSFLVELAKASGLAAAVMGEANLLVSDIYALVRATNGSQPMQADLAGQLFGTTKSKGSN